MSNNQNPNTDLTHLQEQITQLASMLEQINHRLDAMEECRTEDEFGPHNRRVCGPFQEDVVNDSEDEEEDEEYRERDKGFGDRGACFEHNSRAFSRGRGGRDADHHPLDELTKRMKVDVPDFYGKLDPNAFEDWLMSIEDYFDWFAVSKDRKVHCLYEIKRACMSLVGKCGRKIMSYSTCTSV
ncbi:hypothetical protein I3760_15G065400 [Carya illinoinensis]|nr:hypothetical protein I3760_15G065400 [Carya illinoinensis]